MEAWLRLAQIALALDVTLFLVLSESTTEVPRHSMGVQPHTSTFPHHNVQLLRHTYA